MKIRLPGMDKDVNVVSSEEAERLMSEPDAVLIVIRVADKEPGTRYPPSRVERCHDCAEPVMVALSSPLAGRRICIHCLPDRTSGGRA